MAVAASGLCLFDCVCVRDDRLAIARFSGVFGRERKKGISSINRDGRVCLWEELGACRCRFIARSCSHRDNRRIFRCALSAHVYIYLSRTERAEIESATLLYLE